MCLLRIKGWNRSKLHLDRHESCIKNKLSYRRPYPSGGVALIINIMKSYKSFGRLMTTPHLSSRIWSMLPYRTLLSSVFGITLHDLLTPSLIDARSPWFWVAAGMNIADKTRDILQNNFISHIWDIMSKPFHWSPQQIPRVARLMPQPIPYRATHTWWSDRDKKILKNTS
jgi:hypothetical protein